MNIELAVQGGASVELTAGGQDSASVELTTGGQGGVSVELTTGEQDGASVDLTAGEQDNAQMRLVQEAVRYVEDDYNQLRNLPEINGVELKGNKSFDDLGLADTYAKKAYVDAEINVVKNAIPKKVSDLTNDLGFITLADLPIWDGGVT